jgi:hypothetical protein
MHLEIGPAIFWTTLFSLFLIVAIATLVGRPFSLFFPVRLQPRVKFYLAPAFGLAAIQLFIAMLGRYVPLGNSVVPILALALVIAAVMATEAAPRKALAQAGLTGLYAVCTSGAMLVPLFLVGGYNSFNDAFTYLAQSDWLQSHAFHETIPADAVTAPLTQIALYQRHGFRMGGTYLLGFFQALLNVRWSYEIYPAVIFAPVGALCLTCGFPLARLLIRYRRLARLAILSIPAYSLGGVVFAAWYGFLPQSYGELFSAAALFVYGALIGFVGDPTRPLKQRMLPAIPLGILVAASVFSYSELSPFLVFALALATVPLAFTKAALKSYLLFSVLTAVIVTLLLNIEIVRTIQAVMFQKGAIVGTPVNWPAIAYLAHALGIHGGAWDIGQWARAPITWNEFKVLAFAISLLLPATILVGFRRLKAPVLKGDCLPAASMLGILAAAFVYFRYYVASPFPVGTGQSWSQFKLADWVHPLVFIALALVLIPTIARTRRRRTLSVVSALFVALLGSSVAPSRTAALKPEFPGIHNLESYYLAVRQSVERACPLSTSIYLDLAGPELKLRQMLALFLADRRLKSDWRDDDYIRGDIARQLLYERPEKSDCFIEVAAEHPDDAGLVEGKLRIGTYRGSAMVLTGIDNAYPSESGRDGWWLWVRQRVTFHVELIDLSPAFEFRFVIGLSSPQTITVGITNTGGHKQITTFRLEPGSHELTVPFDGAVTQVEIESDDENPQRLSVNDDRVADFVVRNFRMVPRSTASK